MLEHAEYVGNYYGTPKKPVDDALSAGKNIILDIDVQGALQVKTKMPEAVMIFVLPPDFETLMRRIRASAGAHETVLSAASAAAERNRRKSSPREWKKRDLSFNASTDTIMRSSTAITAWKKPQATFFPF